jgi:predicted RNA-binding Zn-ribbon protein involved in translation (DUF1610 family)
MNGNKKTIIEEDIDYCEKCKTVITSNDYTSEYESRGEYWGAPCDECVVTGYVCPECGFRGTF